ncbi:MAG TPA: carbohydrate ABC transporter permease [Candidatus Limnocylindrales bacterium]|nr:carbohydrate ABC transporter permease [Candidatus Limnocylindrales bacterium]
MTVADTTVKAPARTPTERLMRMVGRAPVHIALVVIALIWLVPTIGLFITSFRPRGDIQSTGWWTIFAGNFDLTLENYNAVLGADLASQSMFDAFLNTLQITIPSTIIPLFLASLAAFAFAWVKFPFRDTLFLSIIAMLLVPIQMTLIPLSQLFRELGLIGTFFPIWIIHTTFALPFGIFLLRNFFITLPKDLIEAARIDGASTFSIFRQIVLPLSVPALASYAIFQFLWVWNDLLVALVFAPRPAGLPMTTQVGALLGTYGTEWDILAAASFLIMVVPLAVFFSLQRFFVQGLLAGSVK